MSLYNLLHGVNPITPILLAVLKIDQKHENEPKFPELEASVSWEWSYALEEYIKRLQEEKAVKNYVEECIKKRIYQSGRFRDIYLNEDGTKIILYTRNGGGNRNEYWYIFEILKTHPNYIRDYDDSFDCTYAYIEFSVPEEAKKLCKALATGEKPKTISEKFEETIKEMGKMSIEDIRKDKRFKSTIEILEKIVDPNNEQKEFKI